MDHMVGSIRVGNAHIGPGQPCFVIAEAGVNHNGRMDLAISLIDAAADAGADAVKFQTFKAERLASSFAPRARYQVTEAGGTSSQLEMLKSLELTYEEFRRLCQHCAARGVMFLSSPFDEDSADFLGELGVAAFKIGSGEITNLPFLAHVARKGKPMLLSTGMSYLGEVDAAVHTIFEVGNQDLALFHCTSNYPTAPADVNLRAMQTLEAAFGVPVGYSDHTEGIEIPLAAVALGACMIEKHFTLDKSLPGPDHKASILPGELASLVRGVRHIEASLGSGIKRPAPGELDTAAVARKSLVAAHDLPAGTLLTAKHVEIKRPGTGLAPSMKWAVIGRRTRIALQAGQPIRSDDLE
jgi:N-acetylneuraminate synthase